MQGISCVVRKRIKIQIICVSNPRQLDTVYDARYYRRPLPSLQRFHTSFLVSVTKTMRGSFSSPSDCCFFLGLRENEQEHTLLSFPVHFHFNTTIEQYSTVTEKFLSGKTKVTENRTGKKRQTHLLLKVFFYESRKSRLGALQTQTQFTLRDIVATNLPIYKIQRNSSRSLEVPSGILSTPTHVEAS